MNKKSYYTIITIILLSCIIITINLINHYDSITITNISNTVKFLSCILLSIVLVGGLIVCLSFTTKLIPFYRHPL